MRSITVAGYKDLFPNGRKSYETFVQNIPSDIVISIFIALNNELNSNEEQLDIQKRIFMILITRFSLKQKQELINALRRFRTKTDNRYEGFIFGRRYIIELVVKELNNFRECTNYKDDPINEYNIFKAYLNVVDEVNARDHSLVNFKTIDKEDPLLIYRLIWLPLFNQWEWNEKTNITFETFKLLCFFKYIKSNYYCYLNQYLTTLNLKSISELLGSFNQVNKSTYFEDKNAMFKKLVYINPSPISDQVHLIQQTINQKIGKKITINDIRIRPLYLKNSRGYMVIDSNTYHKKNYRGPFFELFHNTSLNKNEVFNKYSSNVSDERERTCLTPILTLLAQSLSAVIHFDDKTESVPDGYIRIGNKIFLFEYKAYLFPERLTNKPDFNEIKKYIDQRFVANERGKNKGIKQLIRQIEILNKIGFEFDKEFKNSQEQIEIYPILVHQDFQFSMPGINHYLNELFQEELKQLKSTFKIASVLLINLEVLLDIAICNKDILYLETLIHQHQNFTEENQIKYRLTKKQDDLLVAHLSFDQHYNSKMIKKVEYPTSTKPFLNQLLNLANISLEEFKMPI